MVSGPEQARLLNAFEEDYLPKETECSHHHEEGFSIEKRFIDDDNSVNSA